MYMGLISFSCAFCADDTELSDGGKIGEMLETISGALQADKEKNPVYLKELHQSLLEKHPNFLLVTKSL